MDGVQDLFDPRQIALFDAIDELSSNVASDIEIPQLIVVDDQKVGKSSVLEAIARFRFPVHESLCTRFPTKLILRRSAEDSEERIKISIEPGDSRTEDDKNELRKFTESLTKPEDLSIYMEKASAVLGVLPPSSVADPPPVNLHGPPSNSDEDHRKFFY